MTNRNPVAVDVNIAILEDAVAAPVTRSAGVLANDSDPDPGDTANLVVSAIKAAGGSTFSVSSGGTTVAGIYGNLTINPDGTYNYSPNNASAEALEQGKNANDVFFYTISDPGGATSTAHLTFNVTGQNDAPTPVNDTASVNEGATIIPSGGVLANDTDPDHGDSANLVVTAIQHGSQGAVSVTSGGTDLVGDYGTLTIKSSGIYRYVANGAAANALGQGDQASDTFTYTVKDTTGATATATLTVTVNGQNDAPVFGTATNGHVTADASYAVGFDGPELLPVTDFSRNSFAGWTFPSGIGSDVIVPGDGIYAYFAQIDSDAPIGQSLQTIAGAHYLVTATTDMPAYWNGAYLIQSSSSNGPSLETEQGQTVGTGGTDIVTVTDFGDSDVIAGLSVKLESGAEAAAGTISFDDPDTGDAHVVSITPHPGTYLGSFAATVLEPTSDPNSGVVHWTFQVSDSDLEALTPGQTVQQFYDVTITDSDNASATRTVEVDLTGPSANAPTPVNDIRTLDEGASVSATTRATGVLGNDTDPNSGDAANLVVAGAFAGTSGIAADASHGLTLQGTYGTLVINADGTYTYDADNSSRLALGEQGADVFTYTAEDPAGNIKSATLTFDIAGQNAAPQFQSASHAAPVVADASFVPGSFGASLTPLGNFQKGFTEWTFPDGQGADLLVPSGDLLPTHAVIFPGSPIAKLVPTVAGGHYLLTVITDHNGIVYWNGDELFFGTSGPGFGSLASQQYEVTATGPSTLAEIQTFVPEGAAVLEMFAENAAGTEATAGAIRFTDADAHDTHTVTFTPEGSDYLGLFAPELFNEPHLATGIVYWSFQVNDSDLLSLAPGQIVKQFYDVTVTDNHNAAFTTTVEVDLTGISADAPTPADDSATLNEGDAVSATTRETGVLGNDTDPNPGDAANLVVSTVVAGTGGVPSSVSADATTSVDGAYGTLQINSDGTYSYTADDRSLHLQEGDHATDVFTYTAEDPSGAIRTATLSFDIAGLNTAPEIDSTFTLGQVTANASFAPDYEGAGLEPIGNFGLGLGFVGWTFPDGQGPDLLIPSGEDLPRHAEIFPGSPIGKLLPTVAGGHYLITVIMDDNSVLYWNGVAQLSGVPGPDEGQPATQQYEVTATGSSSLAEIRTSATDGGYVVLLYAQTAAGTEGTSGGIGFIDPDDTDSHTVSFTPDGSGYLGAFSASLLYEPSWITSYRGYVNWVFQVNDSDLQSLTRGQTVEQFYDVTVTDSHNASFTTTVEVDINGANHAPVAADDAATLVAGGTTAGEVIAGAAGGAGADTDPDNDVLFITAISGASGGGSLDTPLAGSYGSLTIGLDGSYTYVADNASSLGPTGSAHDVFTYTISDGYGGTSTATLDILVLTSTPTVAQLFGNQSIYDASGFTVTDTAANVAAALDALHADGHVAAIELTDNNNLPVRSVGQMQHFIAADADVLSAIFDTDGYAFSFTRQDANNVTTVRFYDIAGRLDEAQAFDGAGDLIKDTFYLLDGSQEVRLYGVVGKPYTSSDTFYDVHGNAFSIAQTYADGTPYYLKIINPDGSGETQTFDPSGHLVVQQDLNADGSYSLWHYQLTGDHDRFIYDVNGKLTERDQFLASGTISSYKLYYSDGSSFAAVNDSSGNLLKATTTNTDGSVHDVHTYGVTGQAYTDFDVVYGANGKPASATYSNGMTEAWTYRQDGTLEAVKYENVTGKSYTALESDYDSSGNLTVRIAANTDGTHTITAFQAGLTIEGTNGADKLVSAGNNDTFVFRPNFGNDTIIKFNAGTQTGHDVITIDDTIAHTLTDLTFHQSGHDTLITTGTGDSILVKNTQVADVQHDVTFFHHGDGLI